MWYIFLIFFYPWIEFWKKIKVKKTVTCQSNTWLCFMFALLRGNRKDLGQFDKFDIFLPTWVWVGEREWNKTDCLVLLIHRVMGLGGDHQTFKPITEAIWLAYGGHWNVDWWVICLVVSFWWSENKLPFKAWLMEIYNPQITMQNEYSTKKEKKCLHIKTQVF